MFVLLSPFPLKRLSLIHLVNNDSSFKQHFPLEVLLATDYHCFILVNDDISSVGSVIMMLAFGNRHIHIHIHTHTHARTHTHTHTQI